MKDERKNRCCNFQILNNRITSKPKINYSFCEKCGTVFIKGSDGNLHLIIKSKHRKKPQEFEPIEIIRAMKKKTEAEYPFLNEEFNISNEEKNIKENIFNSINIYLSHRNFIIEILQKMMNLLDFNDLIFYQCLFFIDTHLSHIITEKMPESVILYYLVGYFLISAKSKETDIYEPNLDSFCFIKKNIYLTMEKILYYEVVCLQAIKYNIFSYSAYDWISELCSIGFVFDSEINKNNEIILIKGHRHSIINTINKYCMKLLLNMTVKDVFIKYSPMYLAFSIIQISREKFIDKNNINTDLFNTFINLFGVYFKDYKKCYEELKKEIESERKNNDISNKENLNQNENKTNLDSFINKSNNENVKIPSKMKSSTQIINLKEVFVKSNFEDDKNKKDSKNKVNNKIVNNNEINVNNNNENNIKNVNKKVQGDSIENSLMKNNEESINDNIVVYDENNDEKNNEIEIPKLDIFEKNDKPILPNKANLRRTNTLTNKSDHKSHLLIDCEKKINSFKSNQNLPKINRFLDRNLTEKKNSSESKEKATNSFLKTNRKPLNQIKYKKSISLNLTDKKIKLLNNNNNDRNDSMAKEKLNSMKKSLFYDNSNVNKKFMKRDSIDILNTNGQIKLSDYIPKIANIDTPRNENNSRMKEGETGNDKRLKTICKSKEKAINSLAGKETKFYKPNRRNFSNNQIRKNFKSKFYLKDINGNINNIKLQNKLPK